MASKIFQKNIENLLANEANIRDENIAKLSDDNDYILLKKFYNDRFNYLKKELEEIKYIENYVRIIASSEKELSDYKQQELDLLDKQLKEKTEQFTLIANDDTASGRVNKTNLQSAITKLTAQITKLNSLNNNELISHIIKTKIPVRKTKIFEHYLLKTNKPVTEEENYYYKVSQNKDLLLKFISLVGKYNNLTTSDMHAYFTAALDPKMTAKLHQYDFKDLSLDEVTEIENILATENYQNEDIKNKLANIKAEVLKLQSDIDRVNILSEMLSLTGDTGIKFERLWMFKYDLYAMNKSYAKVLIEKLLLENLDSIKKEAKQDADNYIKTDIEGL